MKLEANAEQLFERYKRKAIMEQMWMEGKNAKEIADHFGLKKLPKYVSIRDWKMKKLRKKMCLMGIV